MGVDLDFDASQEDAHVPMEFTAIPNGDYEAVITESEMKEARKGGEYLKLKLQVISGEHSKRVLFDNLNLVNDSDECVKIARGKLSAICKAVGVLKPKNSAELHDRPLIITVGSRKYNDVIQNEIKGYKPRGAAQPARATAAPSRPAPAPQAGAVAGKGAAPWKRTPAAAAPPIEVEPVKQEEDIPF